MNRQTSDPIMGAGHRDALTNVYVLKSRMTMHSSKKHHYRSGRSHPNNIIRYSRIRGVNRRTEKPELGWSNLIHPFPHSTMEGEDIHPESELDTGLSPEHQMLRQTALAEAKVGNYTDAIALFDQLLGENPLSATDYNNRGLVHFKSNHHEQALADYNRAIALDATLDSVYNNRANYYAHHGDLVAALLDYDMAIDLNPYNVRAWINQGITFRDLKMYGRAVECFDAALNFFALREHIYLERGRTHHLRGDWNCAIADYQRVITYVVEICDQLGERELRLLTQAEEWLDQLLSPLTAV